ncbi:hypothetical protein [Longimicrobium sp.]|uniref:hypothetical protein n=1 Tax=Longimicrobium sp. TaxID=2029185 RepID=UPI002E30E288|nr:hypothetical protein [Longimicrobium sp.]HEX6041578.1 hypothetical protein [Longimicrobium sp.]
MSEETAQKLFTRHQDALNRAILAADWARLTSDLAKPIASEIVAIPALHSRLRRSRGNAYSRIGDVDSAEVEYSKGFGDAPYSVRGDYLLDWAMASFTRLFLPGTTEAKRSACGRCIHVLEAADDQADYMRDAPYLLASTHSIRAFVHTYLGESGSARSDLESIRPPTLPPGSTDDPELASFFSQFPKALAAALEQRNKTLLRSICSAVLTGGESARLDVTSLPAGEYFATALLLRRDVPKFHDSWWGLVRLAHELAPAFPVLRQFAARMRTSADFARIAGYVNSAVR